MERGFGEEGGVGMGDEIGDAAVAAPRTGTAIQLGKSFTGALELVEAAEKSFTSVVMVRVSLDRLQATALA
jgi:hypothetical protein